MHKFLSRYAKLQVAHDTVLVRQAVDGTRCTKLQVAGGTWCTNSNLGLRRVRLSLGLKQPCCGSIWSRV